MKNRHRTAVHNAKGRRPGKGKAAPNPLRIDPTRTSQLRQRLAAELRRRFARLRLAVVDLVEKEDAFGLAPPRPLPGAPTGNAFDPDQPRDPDGKFASGGGGTAARATTTGKVSAGLARSGLEAADKVRAARDFGRTLAAIPDAGHARLAANLGDVHAHEDWDGVFHGMQADVVAGAPWYLKPVMAVGAAVDRFLQPFTGGVLCGAYILGTKSLHVVKPTRGGDETFAHEITHAIDGPSLELSRSPAWRTAYEMEVKGGQLTEYATTSPEEGLAEFGMHVFYKMGQSKHAYGYVSPADLRRRFPLCHQFFKDNGLWPKERPAANAAADDGPPAGRRIARRFDLPDGSHVDVFVLAPAPGPLGNTRYAFKTTPEKVRAFQDWLRQQIRQGVLGPRDNNELWQRYIEDGFRKGLGRAFDDTRRPRRARPDATERQLDFYAGTKDEFLRSSFARPVARETVELLAGRAYDDLSGVTEAMSTAMSRTLTDGLVQGKGPRDIARDLAENVDGIGRARAETVARTEIIRAHAEGQLTAMENLGVEEVGVMVEWTVTPDSKLCPACAAMEGVVLKLAEAHGMIPRHPNCRCSFIPAQVGEDDSEQTKAAGAVKDAIAESQAEGADDDEGGAWGPGEAISKDRPESVLNADLLEFSRLMHPPA